MAAPPAAAPAETTPFRAAEKAYQLHREEQGRRGGSGGGESAACDDFRRSSGAAPTLQRRKGRWCVKPTDLSAVVDCGLLAAEEEAAERGGATAAAPFPPPPPHGGAISGATRVRVPALDGAAVYALEGRPGFFVVVGALTAAEQARQRRTPRPVGAQSPSHALAHAQARWAATCLQECAEPPAKTNHSAALGDVHGLWAAARAGWALRPDGAACAPVDDADNASEDAPPPGSRWARPSSLPVPHATAASLLRKLRWAAVGPPFDWTRRSYPLPQGSVSADGVTPSTAPPPAFRALPAPMAAAARRLASALGGCPELRGDAALVNWYGVGDTLGGHVDDAERAQDKPIVAFSLGCPGIFLLGGATRAEAPTAVLLRGGDAVVMSGAARRCVHGVPRVLTPADALPPAAAARAATDALAAAPRSDAEAALAAWMRHTRINISVRDLD